MKLENIKTITNGYKIVLDKPDKLSSNQYIYLRNSNNWDMNNKMYKVNFRVNGSNTDESLTIITQGNNIINALDNAVDFAIENDLNFQYCDFYEAQDNDMVDEDGNVIGCICFGNEDVYIPCDGWFIEEI